MNELRTKSGLDVDRSVLRRKLIGQIPMSTHELERLVSTFGGHITIAWPLRKSARRRAA